MSFLRGIATITNKIDLRDMYSEQTETTNIPDEYKHLFPRNTSQQAVSVSVNQTNSHTISEVLK